MEVLSLPEGLRGAARREVNPAIAHLARDVIHARELQEVRWRTRRRPHCEVGSHGAIDGQHQPDVSACSARVAGRYLYLSRTAVRVAFHDGDICRHGKWTVRSKDAKKPGN